MRVLKVFFSLFALLFFFSCSTKRNTVVSRAYHNITARYNGYYYSCENIKEGLYKIEKNHKDNFDKILPVYIYPSSEKAKATFAEFDKAIKKSSLCIQRHAIKDSKGEHIPTSGKWIDNNWINIGVSHFHKRELFSGLEAFEYVARAFKHSNDKYTAMIWMIRTHNEIGSVSSSEPIISLLKNEKKLPARIKNELPIAQADYYLRRGQYTEAATKLMEAMRNTNIFTGLSKSKRARYAFIIGQMFEEQKENKRAIQYYQKTIKMKPSYDMVFYSKIKIARLQDVKKTGATDKMKKDLLRMTKETKNTEYFDVIYYTLGEMDERQGNTDQALHYYQRSVRTSNANTTQKALSYLKLGEINFDRANYQPAGYYYDSAVVTLPKEHKDYNNIVARKKTLQRLIGHIQTIRTEDSLQRLAKMDSVSRNKLIERLIEQREKEEAAKLQQNQAEPGGGGGGLPVDPGTPVTSSFYFYNPNTVALGIAEFTKRWGNRKYEENWRRSSKAMVIDDDDTPGEKRNDTVLAVKDKSLLRKAMLRNVPLSDTMIARSNHKIIDSYYLMGALYKEELNNTRKAVASFEELNQRFPQHKYRPNVYYMLYRIYENNQKDKAEVYKNKLLTEFPESEFTLLIKNPNATAELNAKKSEVESFYAGVYEAFNKENFSQAHNLASEGMAKFGKNEYLPKFEFIRALSNGKLRGTDTLEYDLKMLVARHPKSEVTPLANDILLSIKKQRNPEMFTPSGPGALNADTFVVNFDAEHFVISIVPDDPKLVNTFRNNLDIFNNKYYPAKTFSITTNLYGQGKQIVILKSFANAQEAASYMDYLNNDKDLFKSDVKREMLEIYPIQAGNLPLLYKKKNLESYKLFYNDNYKKFAPGQGQKQ